MKQKTVCIPGEIEGRGGPIAFRRRLSRTLNTREVNVINHMYERNIDAAIVIAGTRNLNFLWHCKKRKIPVVQRLNGINWRHKLKKTRINKLIVSAVRNLAMWHVRKFFADHVVYQSLFVKKWWHKVYGPAPCKESVIYNGVDLSRFTRNNKNRNIRKNTMLVVEGNLESDEATVNILTNTHKALLDNHLIDETLICGRVPSGMQEKIGKLDGIHFAGVVMEDQVRELMSRAKYFLSLDINAACPNAVIESLASGLPVIGFDTGSLKELILPGGGLLAEYGGDPWKCELPENIGELGKKATSISMDYDKFQKGARMLAASRFDLEKMTDAYQSILFPEGL